MQAIKTSYCGPTEKKGSRIRASCYGGSLHVPYSHELDPEENHYAAATALCEKLKWDASKFFGGWLPGGQYAWVHVFNYDYMKRQKEVTHADG